MFFFLTVLIKQFGIFSDKSDSVTLLSGKETSMAFIQWSENVSVDNFIIDQQHKKLVEMVNSLYDAMSNGTGSDILEDIIESLISYTQNHFAHEERFMQSIGFPELAQHKRLHQDLSRKVKDIYARISSGQHVSSVSLANFLKDWLTAHILCDDQKYAHYAKVGVA